MVVPFLLYFAGDFSLFCESWSLFCESWRLSNIEERRKEKYHVFSLGLKRKEHGGDSSYARAKLLRDKKTEPPLEPSTRRSPYSGAWPKRAEVESWHVFGVTACRFCPGLYFLGTLFQACASRGLGSNGNTGCS